MRIALFGLAICFAVLTACSTDSIVGSGNIISQQRTVADFSMLENKGSIHVVVEYSPACKVVVEADDNVMDRVVTDVSNGTLKLDIRDGGVSNVNITIRVGMPTVNRVSNYGSGAINFTTPITAVNLDLFDYGSGDITFSNITCQSLSTEQVGSGNVSLAGSVTNHSSKLRGSGDLHAFTCATVQTAVVIFGSGNADVKVSDRLFADIFGSGNITYDGSPSVDQHVTGSGKLMRKV